MIERIRQLIVQFSRIGIVKNMDRETSRRFAMVNISSLIIFLISFMIGVISFIDHNDKYFYLMCVQCFYTGMNIVLHHTTHSTKISSSIIMLIINALGVFLLYDGGVDRNGFIWIFLYPSIIVLVFGFRTSIWVMMSFFLIMVVMLFSPDNMFLRVDYHWSFRIRFPIAFLGLAVFTLFVEYARIHLINTLDDKNRELTKTLEEVKELTGLLPICSSCKKIRDDGGYWNDVDVYIHTHSKASISHSICPECVKKLYPDLKINNKS